jgi:hypothetical protein
LIKNGWSETEIATEDTIAKAFTTEFIAWMNKDEYPLTRSMPSYKLLKEERQWRPTPQDYMEALEPYWSRIRLFLLDSSMQFRPEGTVADDLNPKSSFLLALN